MGKQIIKISLWSWKSAIALYGKIATLIFALFCVASGQGNKIAPSLNNRALFSQDSLPLSNIKLFLASILAPVYGMSSVPSLYKIDSTITNENGFFQFPSGNSSCTYKVVSESIKRNQNDISIQYYSSRFYCPRNDDTVNTFYMDPLIFSSAKNHFTESISQKIYTSFGKIIKLRIPECENENSKVSIVDFKGETVTRLQVQAAGEILWNTESVAKGVYFLSIENLKTHLNVKIVVK